MSAGRLPAELGRLAEMDWRLFPCRQRDKRPALIGWPEAATSDRARLEAWARERPGCNWAVATGPGSGLWVLDLDGDEGRNAFKALVPELGTLPRAPCQRTGGGGWQVFYAWPAGAVIRNSASMVANKVDVRGEGGYVIIPPSVHPSGNPYRWLPDRVPWVHYPPEAPATLLSRVTPPAAGHCIPSPAGHGACGAPGATVSAHRPAAGRPSPSAGHEGAHERYLDGALRSAVAAVLAAPAGRRNSTLNAQAFSLARLLGGGGLSKAVWHQALSQAARHAGLAEREIEKTLASALRGRREAGHG